jgi:hypothetical protein
MAIAANRRVPTQPGPIRVDRLPTHLPKRTWQKYSAGAGAHGLRASTGGPASRCRPRTTPIRASSFADPPQRCHRRAGLPALLLTAPSPAAHASGRRWSAVAHRRVLPSRRRTGRARSAPRPALALLAPLDHSGHARPRLPGRGHRRRTRRQTRPAGLIALTGNEFRGLRRPPVGHPPHRHHPAGMVTMAPTTPTPSPTIPLPTPRTPIIPIYGCSTKPTGSGHHLQIELEDAGDDGPSAGCMLDPARPCSRRDPSCTVELT